MDEISSPPLPHDPISSRLGYLLRRASSAMMADLGARLAEIGLRPVEGTILMLVGATPGCNQSDLGRTLGIQRANMVPLIAGLHGRGLLVKVPIDGRSHALSLTDAGAQLRNQVEAVMDAHEARFEALLDGADQTALRRVLIAITQGPA